MQRRDGEKSFPQKQQKHDNDNDDDDISVLMDFSMKELESKGWKRPLEKTRDAKKSTSATKTTTRTTTTRTFASASKCTKTPLLHRSRITHSVPRIRKKPTTAAIVRSNTTTTTTIEMMIKETAAIPFGDYFCWTTTKRSTNDNNNNSKVHDASHHNDDDDNQIPDLYLEGKMPQGLDFLNFLEHKTPHYQLSTTTSTTTDSITSLLYKLRRQLDVVIVVGMNRWRKREILVLLLVTLVVLTVTVDLWKVNLEQHPTTRRQEQLQTEDDRKKLFTTESHQLNMAVTTTSTTTTTTIPDNSVHQHQGFRGSAMQDIHLDAENNMTVDSNVRPISSDPSLPSVLASNVASKENVMIKIKTPTPAVEMATDRPPSAITIISQGETSTIPNIPPSPPPPPAAASQKETKVSKQQSDHDGAPTEGSESQPVATLPQDTTTITATTSSSSSSSSFQVWRPRTRQESKQPSSLSSSSTESSHSSIGILQIHPRFRTISRSEYIQAVKLPFTTTTTSIEESTKTDLKT